MRTLEFPEGFLFGTATAAYQVEGAWNEDGKAPSVWDGFVRRRGKIWMGQTGETAVDHYHRYLEDVALMKALGTNAYRFSVSWPRVMPDGRGRINAAGLDFYSRLVDSLLGAGIAPLVTLYHWDLPQRLQDFGGLESRDFPLRFADYAEAMARALGDRVGEWITLNEPWVNAVSGYLLGDHAPGRHNPWATLRVLHNLLLANAAGYGALKSVRASARVGLSLSVIPIYPRTAGARDREAARLVDQFVNDLVLDALCRGAYPAELAARMRVIWPRIRPGDMETVRGKYDFLGVNTYTRERAYAAPLVPFLGAWMTGRYPDGKERVENGVQFTSMGWEVFPRGIYEALMKVKERCGNPPVYVTENGAAFHDAVRDGEIRDLARIRYLHDYLEMVHRARSDGADVRGYFVWTLLDNFEWAFGFSKRFGLVYVDHATQKRTVKASGRWYQELATTRRIPPAEVPNGSRAE